MSSVTHGLRRRLLLPAWQAGLVVTSAGVAGRLPTELLEGADDQVPVCGAVQDRDGTPSAAAQATFAVAAGPLRLLLRAGTPYRRRLTMIGLGDELGASLARDVDAPEAARPVEHSVFSLELLADEIQRCLPVVPLDSSSNSRLRRADPALLLAATSGHSSMTPGRVAAGAPAEVITALGASYDASLEVTAIHDGPPLLVDRLLWFAADGHWWHARPDSDERGNPTLDVTPVEPDDLPGAVAPLLSGLLMAATT
ncbi:MAG: hypothetical protein H7233_02515 [Pseudorhodobacter sp.]|nr:hypothetical protein [Frankiaceae bacterium]